MSAQATLYVDADVTARVLTGPPPQDQSAQVNALVQQVADQQTLISTQNATIANLQDGAAALTADNTALRAQVDGLVADKVAMRKTLDDIKVAALSIVAAAS